MIMDIVVIVTLFILLLQFFFVHETFNFFCVQIGYQGTLDE